VTIALLNLFIFLPLAGVFLSFTLAPLLAGWVAARYEKSYLVTIILASLWSAIQILIVLTLLLSIAPILELRIGVEEVFLIILIPLCNLSFCILGNKLQTHELK
jgi:biotin transporter BioY